MAIPVVVAKVATAILTDKNTRKTVGWIIGIILSPIILVIIMIGTMFSVNTQQNTMCIDLSFNKEKIPNILDVGTKEDIENMRECFDILERKYQEITENIDDENSLDLVRIKAVFYSLYFGQRYSSLNDAEKFIDNFINDNGKVIDNIDKVYLNIEKNLSKKITENIKTNAENIFEYIENGTSINIPFVGINGFVEPVSDWKNSVTSEFGYRIHPITGVGGGHGGIDIGKPLGTPIYAVMDGRVIVSQLSSSYGNFIMIDHGEGFVTLYAHASKLLVTEREQVKAGQKIGEVGSTGVSTGNHLHFETRVNGEKVNPRNYLN